MTALTYCTVVGKFARIDAAIAGSPPVATALTGQVTITCDVKDANPDAYPSSRLLLPTESPPRTIVVDPIVAALDNTGSFSVEVPATDQTGVTVPSGFTYTASFQFDAITLAPFSFTAPGGTTVDLTVVTPAATANGIAYLTGPPGPPGIGLNPVGTATIFGETIGYDPAATPSSLRWFTSQESVARTLGWFILTDPQWNGGTPTTLDGTVDNTAALQAILDHIKGAALGQPTGTVWCPPGVVKLSSTVNINGIGVTLRGAGIGNPPDYVSGGTPSPGFGTTFRWTGGAGVPMIHVRAYQYVRFEDIYFQGNATNKLSDLIYFEYRSGDNPPGHYSGAVNCRFGTFPWSIPAYGTGQIPDYLVRYGGDNGDNDNFLYDNCIFQGSAVALFRTDNSQSVVGALRSCRFRAENGETGISTNSSVSVRDPQFNACGIDIEAHSSAHVEVSNYYSENAGMIAHLYDDGSAMSVRGGMMRLNAITGASFIQADKLASKAVLLLDTVQIVVPGGTPRTKIQVRGSSIGSPQGGTLSVRNCALQTGDYDVAAGSTSTAPIAVTIDDMPNVYAQTMLVSGATFTPGNTPPATPVPVIVTASGSVPCPAGYTHARVTAVGAGGGSGGAGSASAAQLVAGSGAGGAGGTEIQIVAIGANTSLSVTVGTGGTAGTGGPAGGNSGTTGGQGTATAVTATGINVTATGGRPGAPSTASSTTVVGGGYPNGGVSGNSTTISVPGQGGSSGNPGNPGTAGAGGGGGGGGAASATNGGTAGTAGAASGVAGTAGTSGGSGTANGAAGTSAPANSGAGAGGAGAGAAGTGAGGNGGVGGSGYAVIEFLP